MYKIGDIFEYINNCSDSYILRTVTIAFAILLSFYCSNYLRELLKIFQRKSLLKQPQKENSENNPEERELINKYKTARLKEIEKSLTQDQIIEERRIEQEQLAAIYELLKKQESELNTIEIDERELNEQLNLYR